MVDSCINSKKVPTGAGAEVGIRLKDRCKDLVALLLTELFEFAGEALIFQGKDGHGVKCRILGPVDGHGGHGNPGGHLDYG